ncbi:MAG: TIR domain-containing protein [Chloroflexi bacterium]|nr:TIR domain-containing protein [Chloroflexota bacterium]
MTTCFISYSSADRVLAEGLVSQLRAAHYQVWIDVEGIPGGAQWEQEINRALSQSDACLVLVTPDSVVSAWVKQEIEIARAQGKIVIPLLMRAIPLPLGLESLAISDLQVINFVRYGYSAGVAALIKVLPPRILDTPTGITGLRALIVEDVQAQQLAVQQVLRKFGLETTIAADFETALDAIRNDCYRLVTLDMQLDIMDTGGQHGMLLLDELRTYQPDIPVIIISALDWTGRQVRDFLREQNAFDYLPKPFKADDLRDIVESALNSKHE